MRERTISHYRGTTFLGVRILIATVQVVIMSTTVIVDAYTELLVNSSNSVCQWSVVNPRLEYGYRKTRATLI